MLLAAAALFSCKGKDGEPGPSGAAGAQGPAGATGVQGPAGQNYQQAYENGFIKGTIKGTRRDGSAFEEPFEYKAAYSSEGFTKQNSLTHWLRLYRSEKPYLNDDLMGAALHVLVDNKGAANQAVKIGGFSLSFIKTVTENTLNMFYFQTEARFGTSQVLLPISRANNATYKLLGHGRRVNNTYLVEYINGKEYYSFRTTEGSLVYFARITGGYQFEYLINAAGTKVTDNTAWNGVKYMYDSTAQDNVFVTATGTKLHETVDVPADTQTISNYNYNAVTGELTFDYTVKIEQFREENTSLNPVEINGSVKATGLYDGIVGRRSFELNQ